MTRRTRLFILAVAYLAILAGIIAYLAFVASANPHGPG